MIFKSFSNFGNFFQKLLDIILDKDLNFQSRTKSIIKTANQKLSAL